MKPLRVVDAGVVPYGIAYEWQKDLHERRVEDKIPDLLLLLEHPHVYTLGRRFSKEHLLLDEKVLAQRGIEVFEADRGGSITYHGPGQLVGYPILDLRRGRGHPSEQQPDAIRYLRQLEEAIIRTVRAYGVLATRRDGFTGVWVGDTKLAAIGVNVSRGVTKHGFALNVSTDLEHFGGMVPCGIPDIRATSLSELLGTAPGISDVGRTVATNLAKVLHRVPIPGDVKGLDFPAPPGPISDGTIPLTSQVVNFPARRRRRMAAAPNPPGAGRAGNKEGAN